MEDRDILVTVFNENGWDSSFEPPEKLNDFIDWLIELRDTIPEEFRDKGIIDIHSTQAYDCCYEKVEITYFRPQTEEDIAEIVKNKKICQQVIKDKELKLFNELKEKYGKESN